MTANSIGLRFSCRVLLVTLACLSGLLTCQRLIAQEPPPPGLRKLIPIEEANQAEPGRPSTWDHPATKPHPGVADALVKINARATDGPFKPEWSSLEQYQIPKWYKDAKFGIFIHWGAYSVPAFGSEWYPRQMYINRQRRGDNFFQHHVDNYGKHSEFGYKDFIPQFKAEKFDASAWAKLFKDTGARYVIPVAEHHDGFAMYDSDFTRWNSVEMGPKRDVVGELAEAVRAAGMKFGLSSHRAFNWMFYVRDDSYDNRDPAFADLYSRPMPFLFRDNAWDYQNFFPPQDQQFKDDWLARSCELVDKYNPEVFWFDFGITPDRRLTYAENPWAPQLQTFAAYYYNSTAKSNNDANIGVINYKFDAFAPKAAVLDKERSKMAGIRTPFWQTDTAVSASSWGFTKNQRYKKPGRLVDDLVDIVSKNGCLLLNVGPRPDGTIPDEDQSILREIGAWLKINGEAIYGTRYCKTFGEGPTTVSTGHVSEAKDKPFTAKDIRFTQTDDAVYAILLDWPSENVIEIESMGSSQDFFPGEPSVVTLLGSSAEVKYDQDPKHLKVWLPSERPCDHAYVLKMKF